MALVSVIISTYNSSAFVIETLESVFNQTWKEIELVITDDCSGDNTVDVCSLWVNKNHRRFVNSTLLTSNINTGVSANANRGLKAARGKWIKFLGADDTLSPECLKENIKFIDGHPEIRVLFSKIDIYKDSFEKENLSGTIPFGDIEQNSIIWHEREASSQYKMLLISDRINFSPSLFMHRDTLLNFGGFDERFKLLEDYPLWLNLTKDGYKLYFMSKVTVNYRVHPNAINNTGISYLVNPNYFRSQQFRQIYTYPFLPVDVRLSQQFVWFVSQVFRNEKFNKSNKQNRLLYEILTIYLNPFRYLIWLRKHLCMDLKNNEFYT